MVSWWPFGDSTPNADTQSGDFMRRQFNIRERVTPDNVANTTEAAKTFLKKTPEEVTKPMIGKPVKNSILQMLKTGKGS